MDLRLALTMRVAEVPGQAERRDALAQDWARFLAAALPDARWLPLPNAEDRAVATAEAFAINGLVLTGGDNWGVYPERDATETALFRWARSHDFPVLGVCRGAQVINILMGGGIQEGAGEDHAGTRHPLHNRADWVPHEVNSFHRMVMTESSLASGLVCAAQAPDGTVEAFHLPGGRVTGILWHPEREHPPREYDVSLMQRLFSSECS